MERKREQIDVSEFNGVFDLQYSPVSETCKLDIFLPEGKGPFPIIVSIHGGAFKKCDKRDKEMIEDMLRGLDESYAVIGVNYRLSGEAQFPEPVKDIKQALRFVMDNATKYNLDSRNIIVWGGSAGGYFALMAGLITEDSLFDDAYSSNTIPKVSGVVSWFPPTDFLSMDQQLRESGLLHEESVHDLDDSAESLFIGEPITHLGKKVQQSNPLRYINKQMPPVLIQHGRIDRIVPYQQSELFAMCAKEQGLQDRVKYQIFENAGHGDREFSSPENISNVFAFIKQCFE